MTTPTFMFATGIENSAPMVQGVRVAFERQERLPQQVDCDVVQQRSELLLLPLPGSDPYTVQPL